MRKIERIGWVAKDTELEDILFCSKEGSDMWGIGEVYKTKGRQDMWFDDDWPPRKVKITVEEI